MMKEVPQFGIRSTITKEDKKLVVSRKFYTFVSINQSITKTTIMTTDYKVTELFCIIDEFCKLFEAENAGKLLIDDKNFKFRKFLTCKFQLLRFNRMSQFVRPVDKHVEDFTRPRY